VAKGIRVTHDLQQPKNGIKLIYEIEWLTNEIERK
jgi:hypothetical protein